MPEKGSGRVLSLMSAETTVVGTVTSCHPFVAKLAEEMASPLASTLADVWRVQPSRRASLPSEAALLAAFAGALSCAKTKEERSRAGRKTVTARRWNRVMVLLGKRVTRSE